MMSKKIFEEWLEKDRNISQNSINKYTRSIEIISFELESYGLKETNLFNLTDTEFIDNILTNPAFIQKDERGHRMYSVALKHYKKCIEFYNYKNTADAT